MKVPDLGWRQFSVLFLGFNLLDFATTSLIAVLAPFYGVEWFDVNLVVARFGIFSWVTITYKLILVPLFVTGFAYGLQRFCEWKEVYKDDLLWKMKKYAFVVILCGFAFASIFALAEAVAFIVLASY